MLPEAILATVLLSTSCALFPPTTGSRVEIDCSRSAPHCFTHEEVERVVELFRVEYPTFNPHARLLVEVWPYRSLVAGRAWAETPSASHIRVSRLIDIPHELIHVHRWRTYAQDWHPCVVVNGRCTYPWQLDPLDNGREARVKAAVLAAFPPTERGPR